MIDVSDGVATDARAPGRVERRAHARSAWTTLPLADGVDVELAATGGDDYELLFTARRERADAMQPAVIPPGSARCARASGLELLDAAGRAVALAGFEHL